MAMKTRGFTLVEIMIVVAIIALLTAIAIPAFLQYRKDARRSLCINNLRLVDHAKEVLSIKNGWTSGHAIGADNAAIWSQLDVYIDGTNFLTCPDATGTHYVYGNVDVTPECPVATTFTEHFYQTR
jgi:prepilin-type N-terminal cleavage/methylation domain-containing protein